MSDAFPARPIATYRRHWLPELVVLVVLALATVVIFAVTDLDLAAARWFYHPGLVDPWPIASQPLWLLFYRSAPWVTGSLAAAGVSLLVAGALRRGSRRLRLFGLFLLLCVIAGPGLIINGVLKDHWGRPRPRQILEFDGWLDYAPPLFPSATHGKSFPCGHCSVGYLYAIGWWLWRRHRRRLAAASLAAGLTLGTLLGFGRMAAGGHFLSDVVWAGLIALAVAHALYYYGLRIPAREDSCANLYPLIERSPRLKAAIIAGAILLGAGVTLGGVLASPQYEDLTARVRLADYPATPDTIEVMIDTLDVELRLVAETPSEITCTGYVHGFGLPTNEIKATWEFAGRPAPVLRYRVAQRGWFTDIDGAVHLRIPCRELRQIIVRVRRGDIRVVDETGGGSPGRLPALDLRTANGRVVQP